MAFGGGSGPGSTLPRAEAASPGDQGIAGVPPSPRQARAPLGPTLALTLSLACAGVAILVATAVLVVNPQPIKGLPGATQRQDAETALYLLAFAVALPLALAVVPRLADRVAASVGDRGLSLLAAALLGTLSAAILIARLLPGEGAVAPLVAVSLWSVAAAAALLRATRAPAWAMLVRGSPRLLTASWALATAAALGSLLAFTTLASISPIVLVVGALAIGGCALAYASGWGERIPRLARPWLVAFDVAAIVLLALAIPDLVIFEPGGAADDPAAGFKASVIQFHQNFLVGPANQVLAGDAVLVDTASQYGVAPIYLLAGWYQIAPIGYGTTGLLDGLLYAIVFISGYVVLRAAGVSRTLAIGALALAVVILLYNLLFPVGGLLQHGMLRFGLPMVVVVATTAAARWPDRRTAMSALALAALGLSAVWALEAFVYTLFTFAAVAVFEAWARTGPGRLRWLGGRLALGLAACVAAHLVLALATLGLAGELPDWGRYYAYLDALLLGDLADITYDYSPWSGGFALGVAYAASAAAVVLVAVRHRSVIERERTALTAVAGLTAYGIALYSYFVNRSADDILPYVSLPALLAGALWLSLLLRGTFDVARGVRIGGLAAALTLSLLLFSVAASSISERFAHTPLAHLAPGGRSLVDATERLWDPPPIDARAPAGEALLDTYMPGQRRAPVLVAADLGVEMLIRTDRAHSLPFSHPTEDFFAGFPTEEEIDEAVEELMPGDLILLQHTGLELAERLERQPDLDVLEGPVDILGPEALMPQQQLLLQRLLERFQIRVVERDSGGFVVVRLEAR